MEVTPCQLYTWQRINIHNTGRIHKTKNQEKRIQFKNGVMDQNRELLREEIKITKKYLKKAIILSN